MTEPAVQRGPGAFQWNAGGWFGAQVGSTVWLLVFAAILLAQDRLDGALPLLLAFTGANGVGLWLWSRRATLAPYTAIQILVATMGVATLAALLGLRWTGALSEAEHAFADGPQRLYWTLLLYPALMAMFALQERAARRRR